MLRPLTISFLSLGVITGVIYPAVVTLSAKAFFPDRASGSLISVGGTTYGSRLIGQATEDPRYFWGRPSATNPYPTNASASGGSTLAASNPDLAAQVAARIQTLQASSPEQRAPIPQDLVTGSASGLDPHLSREGALWQVPRIARLRGISEAQVKAIVETHTRAVLGSGSVVTVLELNLALDGKSPR